MKNTAPTDGKDDIVSLINKLDNPLFSQRPSDEIHADEGRIFKKLCTLFHVNSPTTHENALDTAKKWMQIIDDRADHFLNPMLDALLNTIHLYEKKLYGHIPCDPIANLKFLMEQHGLKQKDLADIMGSQGNVSQILHKKGN